MAGCTEDKHHCLYHFCNHILICCYSKKMLLQVWVLFFFFQETIRKMEASFVIRFKDFSIHLCWMSLYQLHYFVKNVSELKQII